MVAARIAAIAEHDRADARENALRLHRAVLAAAAAGQGACRFTNTAGGTEHHTVSAWRIRDARAALAW